MGLFGKSGSSFLNFSIMGELDKDKNIKKFVLLYRTNFNHIFYISYEFVDFIHKIAYNKNNLNKRRI